MRGWLQRLRDERGGFAIMFALTLTPVFFAIGYAVDFARLAAARTELQAAVDAAAIAGAALKNDPQRDLLMRSAFDASLARTPLENIEFNLSFDEEEEAVTVTGLGRLPAYVTRVFGGDQFDIAAVAVAQVGGQDVQLDLVMCIDQTGSMAGTINAAKRAASTLHEDLIVELDKRGLNVDQVRARGIYYRDYEGDPDPLIFSDIYPLPDQTPDFKAFIDRGVASGGGDRPEAGLECFNEALETDWANASADLVVIPVIAIWSDAPCDAPDNPSNRDARPDIYPTTMPRTYEALRAKWEDPSVINQDFKVGAHYGSVDEAGKACWLPLYDWPDEKFVRYGNVNDANSRLVESLADAIVSNLPPIRLTR